MLSAAEIGPVILFLNLNGSKSVMLSFGSSIWYCHETPVPQNPSFCIIITAFYCIKRQYHTITIFCLIYLSIVSLIQSLSGEQFLNATCLFLASTFHADHFLLLYKYYGFLHNCVCTIKSYRFDFNIVVVKLDLITNFVVCFTRG